MTSKFRTNRRGLSNGLYRVMFYIEKINS